MFILKVYNKNLRIYFEEIKRSYLYLVEEYSILILVRLLFRFLLVL